MKGQTYIKKTNQLEFIVIDEKDGIVSYREKHHLNLKQEPLAAFLEKFEPKANPKKDITDLVNKILEEYKQDAKNLIMEFPCQDETAELSKLDKVIVDYKKELQDLLEKL